jgi:hypothetical protein
MDEQKCSVWRHVKLYCAQAGEILRLFRCSEEYQAHAREIRRVRAGDGKFRRLSDARQGIKADSQHKTANANRSVSDDSFVVRHFFWRNAPPMKKLQDRKNIVEAIKTAAALYNQHLVGKRFLYVFDGRYIEVIYKKSNFRHLTGVDTPLSADAFFRAALKRQLQAAQISFSVAHPYDLCKRKIKHIQNIATLAGAESIMLEEITTTTQVYRFGTTDLRFTLCFDRETDETGAVKGDCFVAYSLRDGDCFSKSKNIFPVTHIFSRPNDQKQYSTLLYCDPVSLPAELPEAVQAMLCPELLVEMKK